MHILLRLNPVPPERVHVLLSPRRALTAKLWDLAAWTRPTYHGLHFDTRMTQ